MRKILLFTFMTVCSAKHYSQKLLWEKTIGGEHSEYLFDMYPTLDYGFLLAGSSLSERTGIKSQKSKGNLDYYLWKMDKNGDEEWQLSFGGEGQDILKSITPTLDMGYILGGYSTSGVSDLKKSVNLGKNDIWIVKIDARGSVEWETSFGGEGDDRLVKIKQTNDKGFIIIGTSNSSKGLFKNQDKYGGLDYWIIKTDSKGRIEWEKTYGGLYNDEPRTILETSEGFLVGGISNSPKSGTKTKENFGGYDMWIISLDTKGNILNEYVFGSESDDELTDILISDENENFILTGHTYSQESNGNITVSSEDMTDFIVITTDKFFNPLKQKAYNLGGSDNLTSSSITTRKSLLLAGYKIDPKTQSKSYISIEVDKDGEIVWEKELSTSGDDILRKAVMTRDGGVVFAGNSTGRDTQLKKATQGRNDYWVVKLARKDYVKEPEIKLEAFPNPTDGFTQIVINHKYKEGVVNVYDLNGRLLYSEVLKHDMVAVDLKSYASGTYVINIKTDVVNTSIKIIRK